jgi:outer membrane lipoprotein-sorting protein
LLLDGFGQTTQIDLSNIRAQSSFPAETFRFKAPPNTDVVTLD